MVEILATPSVYERIDVLKALTYVNLPGIDVRKAPGDTITEQEWKDAGQTDEDRAAMIEAGSISEDMDAEIHPAHKPVPPGAPSLASMVENARELVQTLGDDAPKELRAFAKLDYQHVVTGDSGEGRSHAAN